jgi:hypothetical protein
MTRLFLFLTVSFVLTTMSIHGQTTNDSDTTFKLLLLKGTKDTVFSEALIFSKNHPDIKTSISFKQPYFVLYIGTCSDINKIKQLKELFNSQYPNSKIEKCKDI